MLVSFRVGKRRLSVPYAARLGDAAVDWERRLCVIMRPMPDASLLPTSAFVGLEGVAHLCTGGEAPWLRSHDDACRRFGELKSGGMAGRDAIFEVYARAKRRVAALLGIGVDGPDGQDGAARVA